MDLNLAAEEIWYSVLSSLVAFATIVVHDYVRFRNIDEYKQGEYWGRTLGTAFIIIFTVPVFVEIAIALKDIYADLKLAFDPVPLCFQAAMVAGIFSYKTIIVDWRNATTGEEQRDGWLQAILLVLIVFVVWTLFLTVLIELVPEAEEYYMRTLEGIARKL